MRQQKGQKFQKTLFYNEARQFVLQHIFQIVTTRLNKLTYEYVCIHMTLQIKNTDVRT